MRNAMAQADVGDDVFGEDPTVNRLEKIAAERVGKEAAVFVPSGTMGNLISMLSHCARGDEVILGDQSHIFLVGIIDIQLKQGFVGQPDVNNTVPEIGVLDSVAVRGVSTRPVKNDRKVI